MFECYLSPPTSRITAFLSLASLKGCICSKIFLGNFQKYPFHGNLGKAPFKNILKKFSEIFWRPGQGDLEKDDGHSSAKAPSRLLTCAFIFVMEKMSQFYDTWTSGQSKWFFCLKPGHYLTFLQQAFVSLFSFPVCCFLVLSAPPAWLQPDSPHHFSCSCSYLKFGREFVLV